MIMALPLRHMIKKPQCSSCSEHCKQSSKVLILSLPSSLLSSTRLRPEVDEGLDLNLAVDFRANFSVDIFVIIRNEDGGRGGVGRGRDVDDDKWIKSMERLSLIVGKENKDGRIFVGESEAAVKRKLIGQICQGK